MPVFNWIPGVEISCDRLTRPARHVFGNLFAWLEDPTSKFAGHLDSVCFSAERHQPAFGLDGLDSFIPFIFLLDFYTLMRDNAQAM